MTEQDDDFRSRSYPFQESMQLQQRQWRIERVGWCVFALVLLLALVGAFSQGILSETTAETPDKSLAVTHQRFERHETVTQLTIEAQAAGDQGLALEITGDLLDKLTIQTIWPEPVNSASLDGGLRLQFNTDDQGAATVRLSLRPDRWGFSRGEVAIEGGQSVTIDQFIYP